MAKLSRYTLRSVALSIVILFLSVLNNSLYSQYTLNFKHITRDAGLPSNSVNCMAQDEDGFIWFGTSSQLVRYDGTNIASFQIKSKTDDFFDATIIDIFIDNDSSHIWLATNSGVFLFDKKTYRFTNSFGSNQANEVSNQPFAKRIVRDSAGNVWILFTNKNCYRIDANFKTADQINNKKGFQVPNVVDIAYLKPSTIFIGGIEGLVAYNLLTDSFTKIKTLKKSKVEDISVIRDSVWASVKNFGIVNITNKNNNYLTKVVYSNTKPLHITRDKQGNFYFINKSANLVYYNQHQNKDFILLPDIHNPNGIQSNELTNLLCDEEGNIWVASKDNGVSFINVIQKPFDTYKVNFKPNGLPNNIIQSVCQTSDSLIWLVLANNTLCTFNPNNGAFEVKLNNKFNKITSVCEFAKGTLLIGTMGIGAWTYNYKNEIFNQLFFSDLKSERYIHGVFKDQNEHIWISTTSKLFQYNPATNNISIKPQVKFVTDILSYSTDTVYFTSRNHLISYSHSTNKFSRTHVSKDNITHICRDSNGKIWGTTRFSGIFCFQPKEERIRFYSKKDGLISNNTRSIEYDTDGFIWVSSISGISRMDLNNGDIRNFDLYDGLQGNEFLGGISLYTMDKKLLFGGNNGFNYFNPKEIVLNKTVPKLQIVEFNIFNTERDTSSPDAPLKKHITSTDEISLKYNQNFFTIQYIGISYSAAEKIQYTYRLKNFEKEWHRAGTNRVATYTNIPHGDYVFELHASNSDGFWTKEAKTLHITVLPPWWNTWFFKLIVAFVLVASVYALYKYRTRNLKKQRRKLEQLVNKRTNELKQSNIKLKEKQNEILEQKEAMHQLKLRFFTDISHEFRTPLTLITAPLKKLRSDYSKKNAETFLPIIEKNANELLQLVDEIMDFRKLDTGHVKLLFEKFDLTSFCNEIAQSFIQLAHTKSIDFQTSSTIKKIIIKSDKEKLNKILRNLLSNAFKFTPKNGGVKLTITKNEFQPDFEKYIEYKSLTGENPDGKFAVISIEDNGIGISKKDIENIFDRYYQAKSTIERIGSGVGLSLVKELVLLLKGNILVKSQEGKGTEFIVLLPFENLSDETITEDKSVKRNAKEYENNFINDSSELNTIKEKKYTLLIADDNEDIRKVLQINFENQYNLLLAKNGLEAWDIARKKIPDLIISDVMMPEMDGFELCNQIKSDIRTCHIPVILLTAKTSQNNQKIGLQTGADLYIPKPFDTDILNLQVKNSFNTRKAIIDKYAQKNVLPEVSNELDRDLIEKMNKIVLSNLSNTEFKVEAMCKELGISSRNLNRKLKAILGITPADYIKNTRLQKAVEILSSRKYSVSQVADETGFSHATHFIRIFKQVYNCTPLEYIKSRKK